MTRTNCCLVLLISGALFLLGCDVLDQSCPSGSWRPVAGEECVPLPASDAGFDAGSDGGTVDHADAGATDGGAEDAGSDGMQLDGATLDGSSADAATAPDGAVDAAVDGA